MSEARFTPGPWRWEFGFLVGADGMLVLQKPFAGVDAPIDKVHISNQADRLLIQAAPELYAALEEIKKWADLYVDAKRALTSISDIATAALAAARGEKAESAETVTKT